jgi:pyrroloquinoline quinone biosynthesis protein B
MAHLPMSGEAGSLALCEKLSLGRRLYTHINNTNPVLDPNSEQRAQITRAGWALAEDGQRLVF